MAWRLAYSLVKLRAEINALYPYRSTISDGTIGDTAHQAQGSSSDHNPWLPGSVVSALDITTRSDADPGDTLAEIVRMDPRTKYVIRNRRIANGRGPWLTYYGDDPHDTHMHVSVSTSQALYDDSQDWLAAGIPDLGGAIGGGGLAPSTGNSDPLQEDDMFTDQDRADLADIKARLRGDPKSNIDALQALAQAASTIDARALDIATRVRGGDPNIDSLQMIQMQVAGLAAMLSAGSGKVDEAAIAQAVIRGLPDGLARTVLDGLRDRLAA